MVFFESFAGEEKAKRIAYALESKLNHPLADCIAEFCGRGEEAQEVEYLTGIGAKGRVNGQTYYLGNDRLADFLKIPLGAAEEKFRMLSAEGKTVLFLTDETRILATFALADTLKQGSAEAVAELNGLQIGRASCRERV